VKLLVGTHALFWWLAGHERLPAVAREATASRDNVVYVSAASAWEVAPKHRLGKLPGPGPLAVDFSAEVLAQGFAPLEITLAHGQDAGSLPGPHRDPFARMLVAQARTERMALVSNEAAFDAYGVLRVCE
jgi:PIN domain nuclease of toxin-antitoxin system